MLRRWHKNEIIIWISETTRAQQLELYIIFSFLIPSFTKVEWNCTLSLFSIQYFTVDASNIKLGTNKVTGQPRKCKCNSRWNRILEIEEGKIRFSSLTKVPLQLKIKRQDKTQTRYQNIDYKTIAGRFRTISLGNYSHQTDVVKLVYGIQTFRRETILFTKIYIPRRMGGISFM